MKQFIDDATAFIALGLGIGAFFALVISPFLFVIWVFTKLVGIH